MLGIQEEIAKSDKVSILPVSQTVRLIQETIPPLHFRSVIPLFYKHFRDNLFTLYNIAPSLKRMG
jgi:hypothetical protein